MYKNVFSLKVLIVVFTIAVLLVPSLLRGNGLAYAEEKTDAESISAQVFVQMGHSSTISSVAFSRDGKYLASGSSDNTIKLWEVSSGKEIRTLKGHGSSVIALAFLKDGKSLASAGGSYDETIRIWDIATGKETFKFPTNFFKGYQATIVRFSDNGTYALIAKGNSTYGGGDGSTKIKFVETATGREVRDLSGIRGAEQRSASPPNSPSRSFEKAILSPDGGQVLAVFDYSLKLLDIKSGEVIRTYRAEKYPLSPNMKSAAFSPDGKMIFSSTLSDGLVLFDTATGRMLAMFGKDSSPDEVLFSPDGKYAVSAKTDPNGVIQMWDIAGRRMVKTFTHGSYISTSPLASLAFMPSGAYLASGGGKTVKLWDVRSGAEVRRFSGAVSGVTSADVSPDSRYALSASGREIVLWDLAAGRREQVFRGHADVVNAVIFSPDGKFALSSSGSFRGVSDNTLRLWETATGREVRKFAGHTGGIAAAAFSPDGRFVLSGSGSEHDFTARLWDVATGTEIRRFNHSILVEDKYETGEKREAAGGSYHLGFSRNGKAAVISRQDHTNIYNVKTYYDVYDTSTWRRQRTITVGGYGRSVLSPDGNYLLAGNALIEIASGNTRREYDFKNYVTSVAFSPDMNYFAQGVQVRHEHGWDRRLEIRETAYGRVVKTLDGHTDDILRVKFTVDGERIVSGSQDGTIRIWDAATGKEIAQMINFNDGEWIVITPEGYYNSSANGDKHLNVRIGNNVYGIDQYRSAFYKPQIVEAALTKGDTQKAISEVIGEQKTPLPTVSTIQNIEPPFVVIKSPEDGKKFDSAKADFSLYIEDRNQTIKKVMLYINGRTAASGESRGVKIALKEGTINIPEGKKTLDIKIPVTLDTGENLIEVIAFNGFSEGRRSIRIYSALAGQASRLSETILPNLWILSIGINKYQDKNLTPLSYAVADAEGIIEAFKKQKGRLFREINSLIISDSGSIKPTYDSILDNLSYLSKASANDIVLLFIAGHGINDDKGDFYFLPADAVIMDDGAIKKSKAIPWRELKAILELPSKKLIFADTCHSEGVSGKKTRGVDNDRFVKELQEANAVIFTSSRGRELSQESDKWKHGAFTYAIIEGISGKADLIKDNKISMKELDTYVSETVPKITNGAQHPITNTPDGYVNFPVAVLE